MNNEKTRRNMNYKKNNTSPSSIELRAQNSALSDVSEPTTNSDEQYYYFMTTVGQNKGRRKKCSTNALIKHCTDFGSTLKNEIYSVYLKQKAEFGSKQK